MNVGYSTKGGAPFTVHKTKDSKPFFGGTKDFLPECDKKRPPSHRKGKINGYVTTQEELTVKANKEGLRVKKCDKCFGFWDSW